jgi:HK97 family phage major capsid protein
MKKRSEILAGEMESIRAKLLELDAVEEPTEEQVESARAALDEFTTLEEQHRAAVEHEQKMDRVRSFAIANPQNLERGQGPEIMVRRNPFEDLESVRAGFVPPRDLKSRAITAIEAVHSEGTPDAYRSNAIKLIEETPSAARLALLTGSPAYRSAFEKILEHPQSYAALLTDEESEAMRAALSTTVGNGGYAIPFLLDPTIILTNDGSANPFRQMAKIVRGTSNKWQGLTSAGVSAEWKTEGAAAADATPTFAQPSITAHLADAYVFGSYEVLQDTDLATAIPGLIADAKDRLEASAFAIGSGSGAPFGVVTSVTAVTDSRVTPTTGGAFTAASVADVRKVITAVPPRHRAKSAWIANYAILNIIRSMSDSAAGSAFWANLGAAMPEQLLGLPVYEASAMVSAVTTGSNVLLAGNFGEGYYVYDRIGMSLDYIPNVIDATTARPTAQRGWLATWRVGAAVVNPNAFRVLKL